MDIASASRTTEALTQARNLRPGQRLAQLQRVAESGAELTPRQAKDATAMLLSEIAFKPMLAEMRKLPFGKELFHGGRTEEIFGEKLDEQLADSVARSSVGGLQDQLMEHFQPQLAVDWSVAQRVRTGASAVPTQQER
jgi:Rod binding domain-containing protein